MDSNIKSNIMSENILTNQTHNYLLNIRSKYIQMNKKKLRIKKSKNERLNT